MKQLLLCSGAPNAAIGPGWIRVDMDPRCEPDLVATLPPVPQSLKDLIPWDRIALIHGIEHFSFSDGELLLRELRPMLAPDGVLILEQPDLLKCVAHIEIRAFRDGVYGDSLKPIPEYRHLSGYTPRSLEVLLRNSGYTRIQIMGPQTHQPMRDFRIEAQL